MDTAEAAIGHDQHLVAGPRGANDGGDQRFKVAVAGRPGAKRRERARGVPAQVRAIAIDQIRLGEAGGNRLLHYAEFHGIGAGLQYSENSRLADLASQTGESRLNRRRMVGKIVVHRNSGHRSAQLHAALDAVEAAQRRASLLRFDPGVARGGDGGQSVLAIVLPHQRPAYPPQLLPGEGDAEGVGVQHIGMPAAVAAKMLDRSPTALCQNARQSGIGRVDQEQAGSGDRPDEMVKLAFDRSKIGEDISMIEL